MQLQELQRDTSATVGTTSSVLSEECFQERTFINITNTSSAGQKISLAFGAEAVLGAGITLSPGGFYSESKDVKSITQRQISAVSDGAGATVAIAERVTMRGGV
jgi:hypothetical protein